MLVFKYFIIINSTKDISLNKTLAIFRMTSLGNISNMKILEHLFT